MSRIILRDGRVAELRQSQNNDTDQALLKSLFARASADSLYFRFFHAVKEVKPSLIDGMLGGNGSDQLTFLCVAGDRALGIGSYMRIDQETAEVSFLVDDEFHGKGFGTLLLEHLAHEAWFHGFKRFAAYVLDGNHKMLQVLQASGYELQKTSRTGVIQLVLPLTETERTRTFEATRDKLATAASLQPFFAPKTVVVVGASRDPRELGHLVFRNILTGGFEGTVYPVNPSAHTVCSVLAYPSLKDVPEHIDLAVIVVPALEALEVIQQCIEADVGAVLILSAGFADKDRTGTELQQNIARALRANGCRLIGPNSLGLINTHPDVRLNASFVPHIPSRQGLSIASQSGALGIAILEYASRMGLGVTHFVSIGNKADVSSNDLLQFWEDDPSSRVIALYIESFGNPRKFSRIARRITRKKPILAVKGAQSTLTRAISGTVAGGPTIGSDDVVSALFQQAGVIRVDTLQEMFDVAALISDGPLPRGRRVAIVTNSAGGAVVTADALIKEGLTFVEPVINLGFDALAEGYRQTIPLVLRDESVDALVILYVPVGVSDQGSILQAIEDSIEQADAEGTPPKPIVANFLSTGDYLVDYIETASRRIPVYPFPEQAIQALAKATAYGDYLNREQGHAPDLDDVDTEMARSIVRHANCEGALSPEVCKQVFTAMGITGLVTEDPDFSGRLALRIDIRTDPLFGPVIQLGRVFTGSVEPVYLQAAVRITPLTNVDALEVAQTVADWEAVCDTTFLAKFSDLLLRLSRLVEEVPEITSLALPAITVNHDDFTIQQTDIQARQRE